jgi:hypothetical protein
MSSYKRWKADPEAQQKREAEALEKKKAAEAFLKEHGAEEQSGLDLTNGVLGSSASGVSATSSGVDNTLLLYRREQLKAEAKAKEEAEAARNPAPAPPPVIPVAPPPQNNIPEQTLDQNQTPSRVLPPAWVPMQRDDAASAEGLPELFRHLRTGCVTSRPPRRTTRGVLSATSLPDGVKGVLDEESGRLYFWNMHTGKVSWDIPPTPTKTEVKVEHIKRERASRWDQTPGGAAENTLVRSQIQEAKVAETGSSSGLGGTSGASVEEAEVKDAGMSRRNTTTDAIVKQEAGSSGAAVVEPTIQVPEGNANTLQQQSSQLPPRVLCPPPVPSAPPAPPVAVHFGTTGSRRKLR